MIKRCWKVVGVKPNKSSCLFVLRDDKIIEGKQDYEEWSFQGEDRCQIVLPTDVNTKMLSDKSVKDKLLQIFSIGKEKSIDKIRSKPDMYAWTIGKYFTGFYTAKGLCVKDDGKIYNEDSIVIDCIGIHSGSVNKVARELLELFKQESVLVKYSFLYEQTDKYVAVAFFVTP